MKDLFDPTQAEDLQQRIKRLGPETARLWGSMTPTQTPTQTPAHCTAGLQMATGILHPKRASFPVLAHDPCAVSA